MRLLLDTHALLWWLTDDPRLGPAARNAIGDPASVVLSSVVALWEIAIKARIGKLTGDVAEMAAAVANGGFTSLAIELPHLIALGGLARHHGDPFDHLLVAQAIVEDAGFVTANDALSRYPVRIVACH